jgi:hypothetical protein
LSLHGCRLFTALKHSLDGQKYKDDREMETVATRWFITQNKDWYQQGTGKLF